MMNTNDAVNEILRRKDAFEAKRRTRVKKIISVTSVLLVFLLTGGSAVLFGLSRSDGPVTPPTNIKVTSGHTGTVTNGTTAGDGNEFPNTEVPTGTEPYLTEPVDTGNIAEKIVSVDSFNIPVYYPKTDEEIRENAERHNSQNSDGFASMEPTDETVIPSSYRLDFNMVTNIFEDDDVFFIDSEDIPDKFPIYSAETLPYNPSRIPYVKFLAEKLFGSSVAETIDSSSYLHVTEDTITRINVGFDILDEVNNGVQIIPKIDYRNPGIYKSDDLSVNDVFDYVISLPHFNAIMSYAELGDYMVLKKCSKVDHSDVYRFTLIPKTDDPIEAMVYRSLNYVSILVVLGDTASDSYIDFSATNTPYDIEEYVEPLGFTDAYENVMAVAEKYGVREYFEDNIICRLNTSYSSGQIIPSYAFYVAFADENGDKVYYLPHEEGVDENGDVVSYWRFASWSITGERGNEFETVE